MPCAERAVAGAVEGLGPGSHCGSPRRRGSPAGRDDRRISPTASRASARIWSNWGPRLIACCAAPAAAAGRLAELGVHDRALRPRAGRVVVDGDARRNRGPAPLRLLLVLHREVVAGASAGAMRARRGAIRSGGGSSRRSGRAATGAGHVPAARRSDCSRAGLTSRHCPVAGGSTIPPAPPLVNRAVEGSYEGLRVESRTWRCNWTTPSVPMARPTLSRIRRGAPALRARSSSAPRRASRALR